MDTQNTQALAPKNLNPTFARPELEVAPRIRISTDDPLAFNCGEDDNPRELMAVILGGVPRYSAKDAAGTWHNFNTKGELDGYVADNPAAQRSQKYQLTLILPNDERHWLFDLPHTSSIAFWNYKEAMEQANRPVAGVISRMTIVREKQAKNPSNVYSLVRFEYAGDVAEPEKAEKAPSQTQNAGVAEAIAAHISGNPADNSCVDEFDALDALPIQGKEGKANWGSYIRLRFAKKYGRDDNDPVTFRQLVVPDRKAVIAFMREQAERQGLNVPPGPPPNDEAEPDF